MGRQDLAVELYYGGAWQPAPAYVRDPATTTRGRGEESGGVTPSTLSGTLDNRTGAYNPRNASSPLYGLVGRNTPIRSGLDLAVESFGAPSVSGWPGWTVSGSAAADFTISGGLGRHAQPLKNIVRVARLAEDRRDVEQVTEVSIPAVAVGASAVVGHVARHNGSDYYWFRLEFDVGGTISAKISRTFTELAARSGIPGLTYTAGQSYTIRSSVTGSRLAIRVWPTGTPEPSAWTLTAFDTGSSAITAAGRYGLASWVVGGNSNTTEVRFDNYRAVDRRFVGEVASWKPGRTVSFDPVTGTKGDAWTGIEAGGILRRLAQGAAPSKSALRRTTEATGPAAYWPMEDGFAAGQAASVLPGQPPLSVSGPLPEFKAVDDFQDPFDTIRYGTSALADLANGARLRAFTAGTTGTSSTWTVGVAAGGLDPANISKDVDLLEWETPGGTYVRWRLRFLKAATRAQVLGYTADGAEFLFIERIGVNIGFGPRYVSGRQIGSTLTIDLYDTAGATPDQTFTTAATNAAITSIAVNASGATSTAPMPVGHVAVWAAGAPPAVLASTVDAYGVLVYGPWASWHNEAATNRLVRVAAEAGVTVEMPPVPADGVRRMGWQPTATLEDLVGQCVDVDGGILYEPRDGLTLAYRPLDSLYNQTPKLTIDWAAGQVAPPFDPVVDDLAVRNDVTAKRAEGSSARAVQTSGPLAALPPPAGVGVYDTSLDFNLADDSRLADLAWWAVGKGTVDEMRVSRVTVDLLAQPALAAAAAAVDVGDRIAVVGLPADMGSNRADLIVLGYTETTGSHTRTITFNCAPARPYDVAVVDGPQRVAADGSALVTSLATNAPTLLLSSAPANGPWTTDASDMPLEMRVGGEQIRISAIAPSVVDAFGRSTASGWGTADSGQVWITTGGAAADYSVSGGTARQVHNGVGVLHHSFVAPGGSRNFTMVTDVMIPVMPAGAGITVWAVVRDEGTSDYYAAQLNVLPSGATTLNWFKRVGGSLSGLGSAVNVGTNASGTWWRISAAAYGTSLLAKAWIPPAPEPGWQAIADDSSIAAGTQVGILSRLETGNTNTLPVTVFVDNFAVISPQTATIQSRALNGVARVWPAGTEADVWFPAYAAL
ncbi:hypothetical protein ABZ783_07080 [Micromonospora sp. NPDC047738]|uniref:hypothetical protein n=1 Tax=Micromonospora sp. NPDC047738 TaxID=3155741 RepID=UPI0033F7246F